MENYNMLKDLFFKLNKKVNDKKEPGVFESNESIITKCPNCKKILYSKELYKRLNVCSNCDHHLMITSTERMEAPLDEDSGTALFEGIKIGRASCREGG